MQRGREKEKPLLEASLKIGLNCSSARVSPLTPTGAHVQCFPGVLPPYTADGQLSVKKISNLL